MPTVNGQLFNYSGSGRGLGKASGSRETGPPGIILGEEDLMAALASGSHSRPRNPSQGQFPLRQRQSIRVLPRRPQDERPGYPIKECRLLMGGSLIIQGAADASERPKPARSRETGPSGIILGEEDLMAALA
ncbi:hypothetical protein CDAR_539371 [Caerostris darwini]|uniref:Uncharacterized protein n=1 Tax=Caerostris darwini TaxID=1538125 RepID=A0AAV4WI89_9ARAC|nr:hypothetical protein CDAR_539371 [Caerostris darwini]